ncbi:MAG TPA: molybdenum cofactor biosynthesis protein MoaE [Candidatus Methylomirabilis sp.]|nr:molybdenum cofactor biosynthesis protein MoaE [Candidatus Methylomirabilis sp.]
MTIQLREMDFDPCTELASYQDQVVGRRGQYGAVVSFVGTMRDFNEGRAVQSMTLEHYSGMTEKNLEQISVEARRRWDILDTLIIHRVGEVRPNDPIVLVAVWAAHRAAAFEACRYLIEELKARAPFWKNERLRETSRWVKRNTPAA